MISIDATGSMGSTINGVKTTICSMFDRIKAILDRNDIDPERVYMKVAFFRNYNSLIDQIYGESKWENNSYHLVTYLNEL